MSCERSIVTLGNERVMKFKCDNCQKGASVEKSIDCMHGVLEALIADPDVDVIVLAEVYEHEYSGSGLEALKEIAEILKENRCWALAHLTPDDCRRCEAARKGQLEQALDALSHDPASGLRKLREFSHEMTSRSKRGAKKCKACRAEFLKDTLEPIIISLERSTLLRGGKGREGYAEILQPLARPCFLTSRLRMEPPSGCELIDAYEVGGSEVRIYRLTEQLQNLYFLIPPEYHLPHDHVQLLQRARQLMLEHIPALDPNPLRAREQIKRLNEDLMAKLVVGDRLQISRQEVTWLAEHLARFTAGFGLLEALLADTRVQDIYVDAPVGKTPVHICHRDHDECLTNIFLTPDDAESLISRFRAISGRPFSEADPVLDLNLKDVRVAAIGHPLSPAGLAFALRRHKPTPWTLPQFIHAKFLTPYAAGLLSLLVDAQASLLVTGSRGAGKTSLLGALMLELLPKFRIITIEDTRELPIEQFCDLGFKVQALQVQSAISGTAAELGADDALRAALRLGESVLVVGEVRGEEAKTLYEAMRVGAAGNSVMGTIHGATARDVFERVVYDLGIPPSSFKATDAIIVAAPIRLRGSAARVRRLVQITEVRKGWRKDPAAEEGFENLMYYDRAADELRPTRVLHTQRSELIASIARKWGTTPREVMGNLEFRAKIHEALVDAAKQLNKPEMLEADFVVRSNLAWHALFEEQLRHGRVNYPKLFRGWRAWLLRSTRNQEV
ncbi:MAG: type II/IV secretion system ATPase subunit [Candidatus Hodarchaeaceae archaeon]|nr:type II/IV secretion system ATPase subunit [Candidatus Hodarchaeaceae archaeon]